MISPTTSHSTARRNIKAQRPMSLRKAMVEPPSRDPQGGGRRADSIPAVSPSLPLLAGCQEEVQMSQHTLQNNREGAHDTALTVSWPCHRPASACPGADPRGAFLCTVCVSPPGKGPATRIPCDGPGCRRITPSLPKSCKSGPDPACRWAMVLRLENWGILCYFWTAPTMQGSQQSPQGTISDIPVTAWKHCTVPLSL